MIKNTKAICDLRDLLYDFLEEAEGIEELSATSNTIEVDYEGETITIVLEKKDG